MDTLINWILSLFSALRKLQSTIDGILPREQQIELIELILAAGRNDKLDSKQKKEWVVEQATEIVKKAGYPNVSSAINLLVQLLKMMGKQTGQHQTSN